MPLSSLGRRFSQMNANKKTESAFISVHVRPMGSFSFYVLIRWWAIHPRGQFRVKYPGCKRKGLQSISPT